MREIEITSTGIDARKIGRVHGNEERYDIAD